MFIELTEIIPLACNFEFIPILNLLSPTLLTDVLSLFIWSRYFYLYKIIIFYIIYMGLYIALLESFIQYTPSSSSSVVTRQRPNIARSNTRPEGSALMDDNVPAAD